MVDDPPIAWMLWCWNSDPTMLSHSIVEGMFSDFSSKAVRLPSSRMSEYSAPSTVQ